SLLAVGDLPLRLRLAQALEDVADLGPRRELESLHDLLAVQEAHGDRGALLVEVPPQKLGDELEVAHRLARVLGADAGQRGGARRSAGDLEEARETGFRHIARMVPPADDEQAGRAGPEVAEEAVDGLVRHRL